MTDKMDDDLFNDILKAHNADARGAPMPSIAAR